MYVCIYKLNIFFYKSRHDLTSKEYKRLSVKAFFLDICIQYKPQLKTPTVNSTFILQLLFVALKK